MKAAQRGVALITAMLIVAIIATLATSLALGQQMWLRQTQNLTDLAQADRVRQGALDLAAMLLAQDAKNSKTDDLTELWAKPIVPPPDQNINFVAKIEDAQARFNLNNLVPQQNQTATQIQNRIFTTLLTELGLSPDLLFPLVDWLDADNTTQPNGAEDLDYLNLNPPYRAANRPLTSVDELRLIKGYTPDIVEKLRPFVTVLPAVAGPKPINVNTAPWQLIAALANSDQAQAQQFVAARDRAPLSDPAAFQTLFGANAQLAANTYAVQSSYFIVTVVTRIGRVERRTEALIDRSNAGTSGAEVLWYREPSLELVLDEDKS